MDFVELDKCPVGASYDDAIASEVVHIVAAYAQFAYAVGRDADLVHSFDSVAFDEHIFKNRRDIGHRRISPRTAYTAADGGAAQTGAAHLSPDVVYEVVFDDDVAEYSARLFFVYQDSVASYSHFRGISARDLETDDFQPVGVEDSDGSALLFADVDYWTSLSVTGEDNRLLRCTGTCDDKIAVESGSSFEENLVAGLECGGVNFINTFPGIADRKSVRGIIPFGDMK